MRAKEIMDAWGRDEIDTFKAIVLMKNIAVENNIYIQENKGYIEEVGTGEVPLGNPYDPESEWNSYMQIKNEYDFAKLENEQIERFQQSIKEGMGTATNSIPAIIWQGKQSDLARIYKDLFTAGLITVSGRDFSKHFNKSNGEPMPEDFQESKGTNQDDISPKQDIAGLQKKIRGMKPESVE